MPEKSLSPFELIEQIKEKESLIQKEKTASKRQKDKLQELQERVRTLQKQHHIESNVQKEYQKIDVQTINTILDDQLDLKKRVLRS